MKILSALFSLDVTVGLFVCACAKLLTAFVHMLSFVLHAVVNV